jgi:VanZ family protein
VALFCEIFCITGRDCDRACLDHVSISDTMKRIASILFRWLLVLSYASLILFLSMQSSIPGHSRVPDKLGHALEYMLLAFLLIRAMHTSAAPYSPRNFAWSWVICSLFAVLDEFVQSHVPGRNASVGDWGADFAGISLTHLLLLRRSSKERSLAGDEMS